MDTRTEAAARLLSEKLDLDLPPELLASALIHLSLKPVQIPADLPASVPDARPAEALDTRPLAGIVGNPHGAGPLADGLSSARRAMPDDELSMLLPQLLKQLGSKAGNERRAELAAAASLIGALLGGSKKKT